MSAEFTPGPWSVGPAHVVAQRTVDAEGRRVTRFVAATCMSRPLIEGETAANARLIAAAPELLEALTDARQALWAIEDSAVEAGFDRMADIIATVLTKANASLAKARGETL